MHYNIEYILQTSKSHQFPKHRTWAHVSIPDLKIIKCLFWAIEKFVQIFKIQKVLCFVLHLSGSGLPTTWLLEWKCSQCQGYPSPQSSTNYIVILSIGDIGDKNV